MTRMTYKVVRRPGGWAVEFETDVLCCFKTLEQAVAEARQRGREGWEGSGTPSLVQVQTPHGVVRTEVAFGYEHA